MKALPKSLSVLENCFHGLTKHEGSKVDREVKRYEGQVVGTAESGTNVQMIMSRPKTHQSILLQLQTITANQTFKSVQNIRNLIAGLKKKKKFCTTSKYFYVKHFLRELFVDDNF